MHRGCNPLSLRAGCWLCTSMARWPTGQENKLPFQAQVRESRERSNSGKQGWLGDNRKVYLYKNYTCTVFSLLLTIPNTLIAQLMTLKLASYKQNLHITAIKEIAQILQLQQFFHPRYNNAGKYVPHHCLSKRKAWSTLIRQPIKRLEDIQQAKGKGNAPTPSKPLRHYSNVSQETHCSAGLSGTESGFL